MSDKRYILIAARLVSAIALGASLSAVIVSPAAAESDAPVVATTKAPLPVSERIAAIRAAVGEVAGADILSREDPQPFDQVTHVATHDKSEPRPQPTKF